MKNVILTTAKIALVSLTVLSFSSCKKDSTDEPTPSPTAYTIPASYNFSNVQYTGQTQRLIMLDSISNELKKGNSGATLDATILKNKYSN